MHFLHSMRMCMWFGYNLDFFFLDFFPHCGLSHFSPSICSQWVHCTLWSQLLIQFYTSLFETVLVFSPYSEDVYIMCFSYNSCLNFCHFFLLFEHCHFLTSDVCNFSYNFKLFFFLIFAHIFFWVCRSAYGLDMIFKFIFVTFSTLTLSFSYLRFYESVQTVGTRTCTFWAQLLMHHMRKRICFWWNSCINFFHLK